MLNRLFRPAMILVCTTGLLITLFFHSYSPAVAAEAEWVPLLLEGCTTSLLPSQTDSEGYFVPQNTPCTAEVMLVDQEYRVDSMRISFIRYPGYVAEFNFGYGYVSAAHGGGMVAKDLTLQTPNRTSTWSDMNGGCSFVAREPGIGVECWVEGVYGGDGQRYEEFFSGRGTVDRR